MTDSPSPIDSSFDVSDVATPCTVIARTALREREDPELTDEEENEDFEEKTQKLEHQDDTNIYVDDFSKDFSEDASSVMEPLAKPLTFARTVTKVYYYIDDQEMPYMTEVHVPPDCITLRDVKRKLTRTNFKYYCIALDPDTGLEVKAEVRDDSRRLYPLKNGRFELYLLSVEGSVHSDASSGRARRSKAGSSGSGSRDYQRAAYKFDNPSAYSDNESQASSLPTYVKKAHAYNRRQAPQSFDKYSKKPSSRQHHHHHQKYQNRYEDTTFDVTTESEDNHYRDGETFYDEDDDDSRSINTDLTSVSQVHLKQRWRQQQQKEMQRNKWRRMPSMSTTSSSFSSITESSMGLEVITVRLKLDTMPLGMIPSGHVNARGDAGLFVGAINDRGAVALDGRIDVGDMILAINDVSLSNYSNNKAVQLLREAVQRQVVTLTIAKTGDSTKKSLFPRNTREEAVRPIDTNEWLNHATNALKAMPSISEESSSTPIPDDWPTNSSASGTPFGGPLPTLHCMTIRTDKKAVVEVMAQPGSGLEIKDREWLKIPIPMSFLGRDLVDWLLDHVKGLQKRDEACSFAGDMLKLGYIQHVVDKKHFSEKCYYVMGEECADYTQLRAPDGGFKYPPSQASSHSSAPTANNNIFPPSMYPPPAPGARNSAVLHSMVSEYASMPASPFPPKIPTRDDQRSQTSGSSRGSSRRYVELPRKPASHGSGSGISDSIGVDRVASRSSFRAAMSGSLRQFNIDN